ncbi:MAG: HAD hydrolase family protein [Planctomycetes bacterium]|nr:HAD hydrolase family protein [Planctomycetota bacterium]
MSAPTHGWSAPAWAKLARIELVALDVDGVLTDGRIVYGYQGPHDELMHFHVQDGLALRWLKKEGLRVVWITGRGCAATRARAKELEADELVERSAHKGTDLRALQQRFGVARENTLAMGDDLPDLALRGDCALFAAPANACDDVKERADHVTRAIGGHGAVREVCEALLRARGRWSAIVDAALR